MNPVLQTIFTPPHGNCLQACIASILELPLEEVPNFMQFPDQWLPRYEHFLRTHNLQPVHIRFDGKTPDWEPWGYHLISVKSPRGDYDHSLVGYQGKPVHDPFPGGECVGEVIGWELLVSVDPQFGDAEYKIRCIDKLWEWSKVLPAEHVAQFHNIMSFHNCLEHGRAYRGVENVRMPVR